MRVLTVLCGVQTGKELFLAAQFACRPGDLIAVMETRSHNGDGRSKSPDCHPSAFVPPAGVSVRHLTCSGSPARQIINEAVEGRYDLIILGQPTGRRWPFMHMCQRVISHAPCAVAIVRDQAAEIRRMLLCVSSPGSPSPHSRFAARLLERLGSGCQVTLLHVMSQISVAPGASAEWQLRADAEEMIRKHTPEGELLQQDMALLSTSGAEVTPRIRHGLVVDEISAEAQSGRYDLVIIGANQNRGWRRFLLDNLEHQIVERVSQPVLII